MRAREGLLPCVGTHVLLNMVHSMKHLSTELARICSDVHVTCLHVLPGIVLFDKLHSTNLTDERFLASVRELVPSKVVQPSEPFTANVTLVRLVTCVVYHVACILGPARKLHPTSLENLEIKNTL